MNKSRIENLITILFHPNEGEKLLNYLKEDYVNKLRLIISKNIEKVEEEFNLLKTDKLKYRLKLFNELEDLILYELELV